MLVELASGSSFADNFKLISSSIGQSWESSESEILSSDSSSPDIYCPKPFPRLWFSVSAFTASSNVITPSKTLTAIKLLNFIKL